MPPAIDSGCLVAEAIPFGCAQQKGNKSAVVRERQPVETIWQSEKIPAWLK